VVGEDVGVADFKHRRYAQWLTVLLLSVAGVATSWNGYQAALWGSIQSKSYGRANALRLESARADSAAEQLRAIDVAVFMAWVDAWLDDNATAATFFEERFRDEFKPAFRAWLAQDPLESHAAVPSPFHLPEYRLARAEEALALTERAEDALREGQEASALGDTYIMHALILATVLFFAGISKLFRVPAMQYLLLGLAAALLVYCAGSIVMLPKAL
jgi:hypothetical protein